MVKRASCGRGWGELATMAVALGLSLMASAAAASDRSTCKFFSQLPDDCAAAEQRKYDNLRGYRFEQIDLYARDVIKKLLYVSIYNTTGQNDGDDTRELGAPVLRRAYGPKKIAKQYQATAVRISPPRYWALDWFVDRVGAVRNFDGLDAAWMGNGQAAEALFSRKPPPRTIARRPSGARRSRATRRGRRSICSTTPRGAPGCSPPTRPPPCRAETSTISIRSATN